jgi:HD-like signal output (HDOD) protein
MGRASDYNRRTAIADLTQIMEEVRNPVLQRLLELIEKSPGFVGLGSSVRVISLLSEAEDGGTREITSAILRDAALTARLLRLANGGGQARSGRNVSTIDQAIVILGLNTVKSVVLSLSLHDAMASSPQARQLNAEIVAAFFCGTLCAEITRVNGGRYNVQEAQVCGLMQNLGRMMAIHHLYPDIERAHQVQAERNLIEDDAVVDVLGMSYADLGAGIARHWHLPDVLQQSLSAAKAKSPPRNANTALEWHQCCGLFARCITDVLFRLPENREAVELRNEIEYFRNALRLRDQEVQEWIDKALADTDRALAELGFPCSVEQARVLLRKASERVMSLLSAQDSLNRERPQMEGRKPIEVCQQVLRQFHDHFGFERSFLCLPDGSSGLVAIAGVGRNASQTAQRFRCIGARPDIFRIVFNKKSDLFIADAQAEAYAKFLPDWYVDVVGARSIMLLTVVADDAPIALLYGDYGSRPAQVPQTLIGAPCVAEWRALLGAVLQAR